jgi:tetratricopeptide (TPR) repeat protein
MRVEGQATTLNVYEGKVMAVNDKGSLRVAPGQAATAAAGQAPQLYTPVRPNDAVQWSLYYPPVLSMPGTDSGKALPAVSGHDREAFDLIARGDTAGALAALERTPANARDARFHLHRASFLLNVGRVDEARAEIDAALAKDANAGLAYALRSVIAVAQNERAQALADAERSMQLDSTPAASIALSYALQSDFQLERARDTLLAAADQHPDDALLQARLAEIWLMFGERGKAMDAARKAGALQPDLARTQIVLGFAALAENRQAAATAAFERAIGLASQDPLAHLGLGLATIRRGELAKGRSELEAAVGLDANNALLRAYLGKGYYEEKRAPLDRQQFGIAKENDPADPTAYLYDAIEKQTTNRPVEALHDLQTSIELNDNRAVYRSRLLLDSDLAARGASVARIYTDLGFQQRALVEGWKSVNIDPGNFSAHRFLADTYSALPRHEIARVSELLQSQLLQPINTTPIQPRLAESDLFLISAGGPGAVAFNEFNQVFMRDGVTFQASGLAGEHDTYAGEAVLSGIYRKASFSIGGTHFTTDGFRENADQSDDIGNAFVQLELAPGTSVQAEYRYRDTEYGDLALRFFPDNYFPAERNSEERHSWRLGMRHDLAPNSTLLGSLTYQDAEFELNDPQPVEPFLTSIGLERPEDAFGAEVQHLFRSSRFNLTSGVGYFDINGKINASTGLDLPPPPFGPGPITVDAVIDTDVSHVNAYAYSNIHATRQLILTLGASGDFLDSASAELEEKEQFNPKLGVTWEPIAGTVLRAAAFRTLKRTLITDQTLEPTQVAGFNQFFDDINGTEAWRYGAAVDQTFTRDIHGGLEFSKRDLTVPYLDFADPAFPVRSSVDWDEYLGRAYLFWTPNDRLALRTEYQYEREDRVEELADGVKEVDTHRVPIGISYFHPSGFSSNLAATYFHQDGEFEDISGVGFRSGTSDFWVFDAAVSYRLPKRYGFVSVGATNLFDREFEYFDTDRNNPMVQPSRAWFARVTIALP